MNFFTNSRIVLIVAAVIIIIAAFLPWATLEGVSESMTGLSGRGSNGGTPGAFTIFCGVVAAGLGVLSKKWSHIVSILFACLVVFLAYVIYDKDIKCEGIEGVAQICTKAGIGSYLTFFGGFLLAVGNVLGLMKPADASIADAVEDMAA